MRNEQSSRAVPETGVDSGVASASVRPEPISDNALAALRLGVGKSTGIARIEKVTMQSLLARLDEAMAALREKEERVKALEACVDGGLKAVNAAYQQANAEQLGQDRTADRLDKIVMEWRTQARSVLSSVQPVSGSREQRGNEEG